MKSQKIKNLGFTLVELLLSIVIFSIVTVAAYSGLSYLIKAKQVSYLTNVKYAKYRNFLYIITFDLLQLTNRPITNSFGQEENAYYVPEKANRDKFFLAFTRSGAPLIGIKGESSLQRVYYRVRNNNLQRGTLFNLDQVTNEEPIYTTLLEDVKEVIITQLRVPNIWLKEWKFNIMPKAIIVLVKFTDDKDFQIILPGLDN